jgi:hypothetical protein
MLSVEIYAPSDTLGKVRSLLATHDGVDHVMVGGTALDGDRVLLTAELTPRIVDALLPELVALGVPGDEIAVIHRDSQRPVGSPTTGPPTCSRPDDDRVVGCGPGKARMRPVRGCGRRPGG